MKFKALFYQCAREDLFVRVDCFHVTLANIKNISFEREVEKCIAFLLIGKQLETSFPVRSHASPMGLYSLVTSPKV